MPNFQVPQFIEQKPKIIGPLTLSQFLYIAAAGALSFVSFYLFAFFLWLFITVVVLGAALALAFFKIDSQPLPKIVFSAFGFWFKPRLYTWQRGAPRTLEIQDLEEIQSLRKKMSIEERIKSIALNITTGKFFGPQKQERGEVYQPVTFITGEKRLARKVDYAQEKRSKK
ncbi:MAG: PrgI family protein [Patescibacteria group bacterium]